MSQVALVTGAGGGIGAAVCTRLASLGYQVVAADVNGEAAQEVASSTGGIAVTADVSRLEDNREMVAQALEAFGHLDLLVLNAGVRSEQSPDMPLDVALYRQVNGINVDGVVFGIDAALPAMSDGGSIVVTASLAGLGPEQANPVYAMGKSAVLAYVRAMAGALAQRGISINALCPGFTDTAILGISKKLMRKQGFPLLTPDDVADAFQTVLTKAGTGEVWTLVPGRPAAPFAFPAVPTTLLPDGSAVELRPFLAPKER